MSSSDGFCSTLAFAPDELGQIYTGPRPTLTNPSPITIGTSITPSTNNTPLPTPTTITSPSLTKASPVAIPLSHPSPAQTFIVRPGSPTRSNSQSSIATMASVQTSSLPNNPTPTLGHVPLVTATNSAPPVGIPPMTTPPQTPLSSHAGQHSARNSISSSVLGKRDAGAASESEKEDGRQKKRRIAPTLVGPSSEVSGDEMRREQ